MMAEHPVGGPAFEDLTARARIRDAALRLFAERGVDGATIRDIAKAAGVSAGLVRHHFGSKEALRDACDSYALDRAMRIKEKEVKEGKLAEHWLARHNPGLSADPRAYAAVLVAMQTGMLMFHDDLSRALGADVLSPEGHLRMSRAMVDFYSHALLSPELAAQAHAAYDHLQALRPPTAAEPRSAAEGARP